MIEYVSNEATRELTEAEKEQENAVARESGVPRIDYLATAQKIIEDYKRKTGELNNGTE